MSISFNQIPTNQRVPFVYVEFDNRNAIAGPQTQPYKILHIGQLLSSGSQAALVPVQVTSKDQAANLFGQGSILHKMLEGQFAVNDLTETWAIALDDDGAGVKATGSIAFSGTATAAGTFNLYVGGQRVKLGVTSGMTAAQAAAALKVAIDAIVDISITCTVSTGTVTVTAKNAGETGNYIDLRHSYYDGESVPTGLSVTITAMASGATNPDVQDAIDVLGSEQYNVIVIPYTDQANLTAITTELSNRWGPITQNDGWAVTASNVDFASLATLGNAQNTQHVSIVECTKCPTLPWYVAGSVGGTVSYYGPIDPARPFQTLPLNGVLPPKVDERFTDAERNLLLYDGIATLNIDAGGTVRIERIITTYKTNALGALDTSYLDLTTILTLSYLRYDFRNYVLRKYPRHKLADDGTRFGPGQAIVTPLVMKAECISKFREWEEIGLVEGIDQFKNDLIVVRNVSDPNRLDILLPPDLINSLLVVGSQIQFLL